MENLKYTFKNCDKMILILVAALACLSVLMIASCSYDGGVVMSRDVIVQAAAYVLGFIVILWVLTIDYHMFESFTTIIYVGSIIFLLLVYVPGLGLEQFGTRAWINLGFTTFQPSEIVKITFAVLMANYLSKRRGELNTFKELLLAMLYAAPFILIVTKEDLGSGLAFCVMWLCMVFYAGINGKVLLKFFAVIIVAIPFAYKFMADYQKERIDAFLHPDNLSLTGNYQVWNSKIAIGSGGFTGKGLFQGTQKGLDYLPVQKSDFIYSVICEELGFIGGATVIAIFMLLFYRILKIIHNARDLYGALLVMGFIGMFLFQVFENIGMTMGIMPVTGVTLPFLSYGGSSVIANMMAVGFILSVGARSKAINF